MTSWRKCCCKIDEGHHLIKKAALPPLAILLMLAPPLTNFSNLPVLRRMNVLVGEVLTALRNSSDRRQRANVQNYSIVINLRLPRIPHGHHRRCRTDLCGQHLSVPVF